MCNLPDAFGMNADRIDFKCLLMLTQPGSASLDAKRASAIDAFVHLHNRSRIDGRAPPLCQVE
eukprot:10097834-Heterocapsa_arctica.AAC.1